MEGRGICAVAHLVKARSQNSETGISGFKLYTSVFVTLVKMQRNFILIFDENVDFCRFVKVDRKFI